MIEHVTGNLLEADAEAYVNTVNTVGVMGKGIALQVRQAFPAVYEEYRRAAKRGQVRPGHMLVVPTGQVMNPRFVINFPTKRHWRGKARLEDITAGLSDLVRVIREKGIRSVAVPPLGCGSGGLDWQMVKPRIEGALGALPDVRVLLFAPAGAPEAERMRVQTGKPRLTPARAAIIRLLEDYAVPGYRLTMLEIQKLAYFLQVAGEPLKLHFVKARYGPYAEALHHVLQRLEGHAIRGYGDRSRGASIRILPGVGAEATQVLESQPETRAQLARVSKLIEGLETPYGLELLATVHWLGQEDASVREDPDAAARAVHAWSPRKRAAFREEHVSLAWHRLRDLGWLAGPGAEGKGETSLSDAQAEQIRKIAARHGAERVRVFGSHARGEAGPKSDIDLLIRLQPGRGFSDFMAFCEEAEAALGRRVDVVTEDGLSPFIRDRVLAKAIPL